MSTFFLMAVIVLPGDPMEPLQARNAVIDRGEVKAGMPISQTFSLVNRGPEGIVISELRAGCGCVRPRVDQKKLRPGESTELSVEINTLAQNSGPSVWKTTVHYQFERDNQLHRCELELQVKAKVIREIEVEPVALSLSIDRETTHSIRVADRRSKPLTITAARCGLKDVRIQLAPAEVNSSGQRLQQVQVTVLDSCPAGQFAEPVVLLTDDPEYRELCVPLMVTRRVTGQAVAVPEEVRLRLATGQKSGSELLRIRMPDDKRAVVDKIEADHRAIRFKWVDGPGSMVTLRLGVEFAEAPASGSGMVKVFLKEPTPQIVDIPVSWHVP